MAGARPIDRGATNFQTRRVCDNSDCRSAGGPRMRVTFLGQAGLFIETKHGSILCDPWFNPAYFASWFPFPSNEGIDPATLAQPDYLFVSHLHHDHFDPEWLKRHVSKDTTVLLPDYPLDLLERALRDCGF